MNKLFSTVEQIAWTMLWIVGILVLFVFVSGWAQNADIPVVSKVFSWAQSHAGLEQ